MNIRMFILPVCSLVLLWTAARVAAKGTDASGVMLIFGILFIAGGALFDLSSAIVISPDFERERNVYIRLLLDSGHSLTFAYFYLFLVFIIESGLDIVLLTALLKNRSLIVSDAALLENGSLTDAALSENRSPAVSKTAHLSYLLLIQIFLITALLNISSNTDHWMHGIEWHGFAINRITEESVRTVCFFFCLSIYIGLLWKSYRQMYPSESKAGFGLYIASVCIFIITFAGMLFYVRHHENKINLEYFDDIINYAAENSLMDRYAEIDDTIQKITSNPYTGKKEINGADALWEYCSHNPEERRQEFITSVYKTAHMLKFSERLKLDDRLATTVDSFSTEIADKAWMHNVFFIKEKWFPCDGRSRNALPFPGLLIFYNYSEIMAVRICRLYRQGNKNTAEELYMKTLHMSRMLFNGDSSVGQIAGLLVMRNLCRDEIISSEIFSEYERKHLNRLKENMLFLLKDRNYCIPTKLTEPLIFYYPDRYEKVLAILEPHRDRNYILPVYYEMLKTKESLGILDSDSGILFPLPDDRRFKEIMRIFNTENKFFLKKALGCAEKNIEICKSENCSLTEYNPYLTDSRFKKFIY
ncbi:MAG: hypothetical protein GY795_40430, partial [Desulfobacterales bacterium]|nr:hypothetical protein [Desulfobacterales bacterium]